MSRKRWIIGVLSGLAALFVLVLYAAIAADLGSESDPLVTVSYAVNELLPDLRNDLDRRVAEKSEDLNAELDQKIQEAFAELDRRIGEFGSQQAGLAAGDDFIDAVAAKVQEKLGVLAGGETGDGAFRAAIVDMANGQVLSGAIGTELMLRFGSGTVSGSLLIDVTTGIERSEGQALEVNHLYVVTIDGRGFRATSDGVKLLVVGPYTVS